MRPTSCPLCGSGYDDEYASCNHPFHEKVSAGEIILHSVGRDDCNWQDVNGVWTCTECGDKEW